MNDNLPIVYYTPGFLRDFKELARKQKNVETLPYALDDFISALDAGKKFHDGIKNQKCKGIIISKAKTLPGNDKQSTKYRIIFSRYKDSYVFINIYFKSQQEDPEPKDICDRIKPIKDGTCKDTYIKHNRMKTPLCRVFFADEGYLKPMNVSKNR